MGADWAHPHRPPWHWLQDFTDTECSIIPRHCDLGLSGLNVITILESAQAKAPALYFLFPSFA